MQNLIPEDLLDIIQRHGDDIETMGKVLTNDAVQVGAEFVWPASTALLPYNYLPEDGTALDRVGYATLFQEIGTTYGVGDGLSTFNIPDRSDTQIYVPTLRTWIALPYAANWADYGSGYQAGQYSIDQSGWVDLRGLLRKATAPVLNETICTLPAGFRPPATLNSFVVKSALDAATNGVSGIDVNAAGTVTLTFMGQTGASTGNISFNGVRFDTGVLPTPTASQLQQWVIKVL